MDQGLDKRYKLCSKTVIASLFESGKQCKKYPFLIKYQWLNRPKEVPFQLVISVPKRTFKRAVDRNRIKRLIREAVRKKKHLLESALTDKQETLAFFMIYTDSKEMDVDFMTNKIETLFQRLVTEIQSNYTN